MLFQLPTPSSYHVSRDVTGANLVAKNSFPDSLFYVFTEAFISLISFTAVGMYYFSMTVAKLGKHIADKPPSTQCEVIFIPVLKINPLAPGNLFCILPSIFLGMLINR